MVPSLHVPVAVNWAVPGLSSGVDFCVCGATGRAHRLSAAGGARACRHRSPLRRRGGAAVEEPAPSSACGLVVLLSSTEQRSRHRSRVVVGAEAS